MAARPLAEVPQRGPVPKFLWADLLALVDEFQDVFSHSAGYCDVVEREIHVIPDFELHI